MTARSRGASAVVFMAAASFLGACGGTESAEPAAAPLDDSLGAEVYAASCASCHGADLRGTDRGPSHLSIVYEPAHHTDEGFRSAIANGSPQHHWSFGPMPAVAGLSEQDVDAVIDFVRAQQVEQGFEPYPPQS